jgi:hypothetical protein
LERNHQELLHRKATGRGTNSILLKVEGQEYRNTRRTKSWTWKTDRTLKRKTNANGAIKRLPSMTGSAAISAINGITTAAWISRDHSTKIPISSAKFAMA